MILLAKRIVNDDRLYFQAMDISVKRNAYGRQLGSFCAVENFEGIGRIPMTFIRAPFIERIDDENVQILCRMDDHIVAARQKNMLVTSFHPELTDDLRVHQYFLDKF
jgi:5'-phosphate synthase pdxT subunit